MVSARDSPSKVSFLPLRAIDLMGSKFSHRSSASEIMDDLHCAGEVVNQTLRELEMINRWLGGNAATFDGVSKLIKLKPKKNLAIADIGCGGGDILEGLARIARRKNMSIRFFGIDANPHIIDFAKKNTEQYPEISYRVQNIFSEEFRNSKFDIVVATLFTHHLGDRQLIDLIKQLQKQVSLGIVINDIHRHWIAYHSIRLLTKWLSKSSMVKYDAPVSVLRSFNKAELESILTQAGIINYSLKWKWAFRWQLIIPSSLA